MVAISLYGLIASTKRKMTDLGASEVRPESVSAEGWLIILSTQRPKYGVSLQ